METDVLLKENDTACDNGTFNHLENIHENETVMGTGECTMCSTCKKYDEENALLTKCKCGHKKRFHL